MYVFDISYAATPVIGKEVSSKYDYPKLMDMKKDLNNTKSKLDPIYKNSKRDFQEYMNTIYQYRLLKKMISDSIDKHADTIFDADVLEKMVTKAHLKIRELLKFIEEDLRTIGKGNDIVTFHMAEAPGAFVPAFHVFTDDYRFNWEWYAESYFDIYSPIYNTNHGNNSRPSHNETSHKSKLKYLGDQYSFIEKTSKHWIRGSDSDGDITSSANILSFNHFFRNLNRPFINDKKKLKKNLKNGGDELLCNLVTSDVKYVPHRSQMDYNEEETSKLSRSTRICDYIPVMYQSRRYMHT